MIATLKQLSLAELDPSFSGRETIEIDPNVYDLIIVFLSGGKDSVATVLWLIDRGVDPAKIELWHHLVDGREGSTLMDWPCTESYTRSFAQHLGIPIYFSWREGGIEREMLRDGTSTAPIHFEAPDGVETPTIGGHGPEGRRLRFPQVTHKLKERWCSPSVKIDVARAVLRQPRFANAGKVLCLSGERAEESPHRARYRQLEPHASDLRNGVKYQRYIDHGRPVLYWSEREVWAIIAKHRINPHPAYRLGFGRTSCAACIFGSPNQWATLQLIDPDRVQRIAQYEEQFSCTINRTESVLIRAAKGKPYPAAFTDRAAVTAALSREYTDPIQLAPGEWQLPPGAYGESVGPT